MRNPLCSRGFPFRFYLSKLFLEEAQKFLENIVPLSIYARVADIFIPPDLPRDLRSCRRVTYCPTARLAEILRDLASPLVLEIWLRLGQTKNKLSATWRQEEKE